MADDELGCLLCHGQPRTAQRLTELLQQAGFAEVRLLANAMPLQTSLLLARKGRT